MLTKSQVETQKVAPNTPSPALSQGQNTSGRPPEAEKGQKRI